MLSFGQVNLQYLFENEKKNVDFTTLNFIIYFNMLMHNALYTVCNKKYLGINAERCNVLINI